jgi:hypothetical protein
LEQTGAISTALRGLLSTQPSNRCTRDVNNSERVAQYLHAVLEHTGWTLHYDPSVVAQRVEEVARTAKRSRRAPDAPGPPEELK